MNTNEVIATTRRAWEPAMAPAEYGAFLNELLEAERAGAKLLSAYLDELPPDSFRWKMIRAVQLDEARNCAILIHLLLEAEATPTPAVGSFYGRGLAIRGWRERLEFLNRGQAWVARRLAAALERVPHGARDVLQAMHDSHLANIHSCEVML
jgi:nitronate monooxygenase